MDAAPYPVQSRSRVHAPCSDIITPLLETYMRNTLNTLAQAIAAGPGIRHSYRPHA